MKRTWKWLGLTAAIAYFVWPADLLPGIVADDIVALVAALVPFVAAAKQLRDRKKQEALPPSPAEKLLAHSAQAEQPPAEPAPAEQLPPPSAPASAASGNSNQSSVESRLVDVSSQFSSHFGVSHLSDAFWTPRVARDPQTGNYYSWMIRYQAGDREGWSYLGSDFQEAVSGLEFLRKKM